MAITTVPGYWGIALFTLVATVALSHVLRGLVGMLSILLGAAAGYVLTLIAAPDQISFATVTSTPLIAAPHLTWPALGGPMLTTALFSVAVMAIATVPESTAHLYQISLYVDRLADDQRRARPRLERYVGLNLVLDGLGDMLHGALGAMAGTNYGENNSLMAITRNYSGPVLLAAAIMTFAIAFLGKLSALVGTVPVFVSGGLALYLFGTIGMQGIALMIERRVNLFEPLQLAIGATIMGIGIGGSIGFADGLLPITVPTIFPRGLPAIATAAVVGIVLNLIFTEMRPEEREA
jgi:uracil permease